MQWPAAVAAPAAAGPKAWRELRKVELRLYQGSKVVGMINARPGSDRLDGDGAVKVMASGSKLSHHGKTVTAKLAVCLPRSLAGQDLRVDVQATDSRGHQQMERDAVTIRVAE